MESKVIVFKETPISCNCCNNGLLLPRPISSFCNCGDKFKISSKLKTKPTFGIYKI